MAEASTGEEEGKVPAAPAEEKGKKKPILFLVIGLVVLLGLFFGVRAWIWGRTHVSTDDSFITGDLINVSPVISGTLSTLLVHEGDVVHKGQLIAELESSSAMSAFRQAEANYQAAMTMIPEAERNLEFQRQATQASIDKAQAALAAQQAKSQGAQQQVTLASETTDHQVHQAHAQVSAAKATEAQADAQVQSAVAARESYRQAVATARASLENFRQQVQTAELAVESAKAKAVGAQAEAERAAKDEARYRALYDQDAISAQAYDNAKSQAQNLGAQAQSAQAEVAKAISQVQSAREAVAQAASQVTQAEKVADQSGAQIKAAQRAAQASSEQVRVAEAGVGIAEANRGQVGIQQANSRSTSSSVGENSADLLTARAGQTEIQLRKEQITTAQAQARQARAALTNAQIILNDTKIYAPVDGMVVRKDANAGQTVSPGATLVTITRGNDVWVDANFKETQLTDVHPGQLAELEVDAFPGRSYHGRVESIDQATGASTALLPPDNATGNFTKVVQRITVRIRFIAPDRGPDATAEEAGNLGSLRQGMSVTATIDTASGESPEGKVGKRR